jgi:3-oxoadipate enol-lactonase
MHPRSIYLDVPDGPKLRLVDWSDGKAACALLIHGFGDGCHIWNEFAPEISRFYRTVAVDLRGHGDSGWDPDARYDVVQYSADVAHVLRGIGAEKVVLIGHSLGAEVAVRVAAACARRVHGVIIVDYGPSTEPAVIRQIRAEFGAAHQVYPSVCAYAEYLQAQRPLARAELLHRFAAESLVARADGSYVLKTDPNLARAPLGESLGEWDSLTDMQWPVLVVRGEGSAVLTRAAAKRMIELLPDGSLVSIRLAGHAVMIDNPEGFAGEILPFLLRLLEQLHPMEART